LTHATDPTTIGPARLQRPTTPTVLFPHRQPALPGSARDPAPDGAQRGDQWHAFDWRASGQSIPQRLHAIAASHPDRPAVVDADTELTYGALDRAANRIANALLGARATGPEAVVLLFDVGAAAVVAALGVGRAGKHFVGVEPSFPAARIAEIARDAGATIVVTDAAHLSLAREVAGPGSTIIDVDACRQADAGAPSDPIDLDSIALLNYTSGSTGRPKGVVQSHRSAIAQVCRYANGFRLGAGDRVASCGSLAWAGPIWDVFGPLCLGAAVGLHDVRRHGLHALAAWLAGTRASVVSGMTIVRRLAFDLPDARFPDVRLIQLGGDTVYRRDVEACRRAFPHATVAVGFGLTEAGRIAEQHIARDTPVAQEVVPVGFAVPGVRLRLVGEDGAEVPAGDIGELVVQSDDLAVGYWRQPALTAERFRRDPRFGEARLYFTGDLARLLPDGSLQHAGRKDFRIKVQGYAVAANEIEALLLQIEGVREACVVARQSAAGSDELTAFLVPARAASPLAAELRARLADALPDYMVPRRFVDVEALPKTPTGKIDRRALADLPLPRRVVAGAFIAPGTPLEAKVAAIWGDVLDVDAVSVHDDFIALGGDSLGAARIAGRVMRDFGLELSPSELLASPTVATMAALIAGASAAGAARATAPALAPRRR